MYVHVQATPGAKKEIVTKRTDTDFSISVREPAERNLANRRVQELVAEAFGTTPRFVRLIAGHRSPKKVYTIDVEA